MLKVLLMMIFMIPLCFVKGLWWMLNSLLFMIFMIMLMVNPVGISDYGLMGYMMGCDWLSYSLVVLTVWICILMITASESVYRFNNYSGLFIFMILMLLLLLMITFMSMSLLSFYVFFEGSLIPTLLLILGWGYQPERLQAGVYLMFYTLMASLPLLVILLKVYWVIGSLYFPLLEDLGMISYLTYLCLIMAFLVKLPMFMVHLWLPKAHVEAPISGSMILAGVLLKLGGYGLIRVMKLIYSSGLNYNFVLMSVGLMGGVLVSLICMRQIDLKMLIAYSSVAHMSLVLCGLMSMNYWGLIGSLVVMVGHGLCSSGLFCLANISYERLSSRSLLLNKGLLNYMPSMAMWWFLLSSSNMASPPSLNLLGEIMLINSLMSWCWGLMLMLMMLSFFSALYCLYMYSYSQHGKNYSGSYSYSLGYGREYHLLMLHWLPLNYLILKFEFFYM
uniref:NADH-ubiquinone oxidoreductase chain 4 n=1 Tax=Cylindraustralia sp. HS-2014 TaxID=1564207 RepID=A0A0N7AY82_9ORTH|nr:NADH dehydrogenase subunit 4 [Cylindraustralia sp. HS-2014]